MGFKVGQARNRVKLVGRSFDDGQVLQIRYLPSIVSADEQAEFEDKLAVCETTQEKMTLTADFLLKQLQWADLTDDDGKEIVVNRENLLALPFDILMFILKMISEDKNVGEASGARSRRQ